MPGLKGGFYDKILFSLPYVFSGLGGRGTFPEHGYAGFPEGRRAQRAGEGTRHETV
jgi:hypothetical protein